MKSFTDVLKEHTASIVRVQVLAILVSLKLAFAWLLLSLSFYIEAGGNKFLRNVDEYLAGYTTQKIATTHSSQRPLWELTSKKNGVWSEALLQRYTWIHTSCRPFLCWLLVRLLFNCEDVTTTFPRNITTWHDITEHINLQGQTCSGWVHNVCWLSCPDPCRTSCRNIVLESWIEMI
jgi:hypothetical protein